MKAFMWDNTNFKQHYPTSRGATVVLGPKPFNNSIYLFGGISRGLYVHNDFYEFSLLSNKWKKVEPNGTELPKLFDHTAIVYKDSMYVFGGGGRDLGATADLYQYNFETNEWKNITNNTQQTPTAHIQHSAVVYKDKMYIFGGFDSFLQEYSNELYEYDFLTRIWKRSKALSVPGRTGHTAVVKNNEMYIFGGLLPNGKLLDDLHCYNFDDRKWRRINAITLCKTVAREGHTAVVYENTMIIFGGNYKGKARSICLYDFNTQQLYERKTRGEGPKNCINHAAVCWNGYMFIFACEPKQTSVLFRLYLGSKKYNIIKMLQQQKYIDIELKFVNSSDEQY